MSFSNVDFGRMKRDLGLKLSSCLRPQGRSLLKLSIDSLYPEKSGDMFLYYFYGQVVSFLHYV